MDYFHRRLIWRAIRYDLRRVAGVLWLGWPVLYALALAVALWSAVRR